MELRYGRRAAVADIVNRMSAPTNTDTPAPPADTPDAPSHFIAQAIADDLKQGRYDHVRTRLPPEPNGYMHVGHAKAWHIDFGMAEAFGGKCNLRFDDTNPTKEEQEFIDAIREDTAWLGITWDRECYASDYFPILYGWARKLIEAGKAYVDEQTAEEVRANRGTLTRPGTDSPYRDRPPEESLALFEQMKNGDFPDGSKVLRAKIDMASPNLNLRDPVMYRVLHEHHPRTGGDWCIYPSYDWAHGQSDWIEGITHSLCSLEFEAHRPLYEWFVEQLEAIGVTPDGVSHQPRQIEFARGNITGMVTSKRKLRQLVEEGHVAGWDDPRMPTIRGMRRRGYTAAAIKQFWDEAGVAKRVNNIEYGKLESVQRADLNAHAQRRLAVLDPLKVVITNYPEGQTETFDAVNNPENEADGTRPVTFSRELWIERDDFMEDPPKKFFRLGPGREVRLRYAYWVKCEEFIKDDAGHVVELRCTYDPATKGGENPPPDEEGKVRKVKGTLHWVNAADAVDAQVRLYDHLFAKDNPEEGDLIANLNPESLKVVQAKVEPVLRDTKPGDALQFERQAYFTADPDHTPDMPVFNRTVTLKDSWGKQQKKG